MFNKVKGTIDYDFAREAFKSQMYEEFRNSVVHAGYRFIETPILESASLFKRAVENSEVANKEMYLFLDKGSRELVLRPEGTASFVRAFIENKWFAKPTLFQKFAYFGPMFRYEQPQKGRYRQFYQAGIEFIGQKDPYKDVEVIKLAYDFLDFYSEDIKFTLVINSIGDLESRQKYEHALYEYLLPFKNQLSEQSQKRLDEKKVLRILDDKVDSKLPFIQSAPKITDFLSQQSKEYFNSLKEILDLCGYPFKEDNSLVRGLDYYDEVVFEFVANNTKGAQSAIAGGGRYSNLVHQLGGPEVSSVGFGIGIDRLIDMVIENDEDFEFNYASGERKISAYISYENESSKQSLFEFYLQLQSALSSSPVNQALHITDKFPVIFEYNSKKKNKAFDVAKKLDSVLWIYDEGKSIIIQNLINGEKMKVSINTWDEDDVLIDVLDELHLFLFGIDYDLDV